MPSRRLHAVCPVIVFDAAAWRGWTIESTEKISAPSGVSAHEFGGGRVARAFPARAVSTGKTWDVHHLTRPMDGGSR